MPARIYVEVTADELKELAKELERLLGVSLECVKLLEKTDGKTYATDGINSAIEGLDSPDCQIAKCFRQLCIDTDLHIKGRGFYGLRRTCETIGSEAKDQIALDHIMGHIDSSMGGVYRQRVGDDRLEAVAEVIRDWLFSSPQICDNHHKDDRQEV